MVVTLIVSDGVNNVLSLFVNEPWKLKLDAPLPVCPSVTINVAVMIELLSNFLPK